MKKLSQAAGGSARNAHSQNGTIYLSESSTAGPADNSGEDALSETLWTYGGKKLLCPF